jgi:hypothetical protein
VARTKLREKPGGSIAEAVAVDRSKVPVNGVESMIKSGPFSEKTWSRTTVPTGMKRPSRVKGTAEDVLMVTSGIIKLPVGLDGTGTPATLTTRTLGVRGKKTLNGEAKRAVGKVLPVNIWRKASKRRECFCLSVRSICR